MSEFFTLKTRELLAAHGIRCVQGKEMVSCGKNPDLFCVEPYPFWVEVKHIEGPQQFERSQPLIKRLDNSATELGATGATGSIVVHVSNASDDTDTKLAKEALRRLTSRKSRTSEDYQIFVVQEPRIKGQYVEFDFKTRRGNAHVVSTNSASGHYGIPIGHGPCPGINYVVLTGADNKVEHLDVCRLHTSAGTFRIALVITPCSKPLRISGIIPANDLFSKSKPNKIRELIGEARGQFKNALHYKKAPCLLVIWQDASFAIDPTVVASAVYGDWKVKFAPTRPELGVEHVYDGNAPFACDKNTSVSALCYIPVGGEAVTFHNFFAARKLPMGLLPGVERAPQSDGSIEVPWER